MESLNRAQSKGPIRSRIIAAIATLTLSIVLGGISGQAQTQAFTATLSGIVSDPSGAVIPKAKVTLHSEERGISRNFVTGDSGNFSFQLLPPANYTLKVELAGFQSYEQKGVILAAGV